MKVLVVAVALIVLANAHDPFADIDWSKVRPKHIDIEPPPGFTKSNERIVGGQEAVPNSIPFQVALLLSSGSNVFFCGGSLLSPRFVLTAAHCLDGVDAVQVRLGAHRVNENEPTQVRVNATRWVQHQEWNAALIRNDIAIIELAQAVTLNANIQPVTLPRRSQASNTFANRPGIISGWGRDSDSATAISPVLRQVTANVMVQALCNLQFLGMIQPTNICTSGSGGRGACNGDSGGPLMVDGAQVGIVSFGLALGCEIGWPSVFVRVTSFLNWIEANSDIVIQP